MIQTCQNCAYHMIGDPPVCNALHTPIAGETDCRDWEAGEKINRGVFYSQPFGYNLQSSVKARDAAIAREAHQFNKQKADRVIPAIGFLF